MLSKNFTLAVTAIALLPIGLSACSRRSDAEIQAELSRDLQRIEERKRQEAEMQRVYERVEQQNREIDQAQNDVIEEYRKKAVKHTFSTGSNFRVDQFVMKGGKVVHCKTTISDYGKTVDCN